MAAASSGREEQYQGFGLVVCAVIDSNDITGFGSGPNRIVIKKVSEALGGTSKAAR
jgi:hypothetical protein